MNRRSLVYKTLAVTLAGAIAFIGGCKAEEIPAPEGYVEIDTNIEDVDETVTPEEDIHLAEAVPYVEPETEEDEEAPEAETVEDEPEEEYLEGYMTEKEWKERHTGSASYIWEPTVIISIFVDEEEDLWTEEEKQQMLSTCRIAYDFVAQTMDEEYDTETKLIYDWEEDPELAYSIRVFEEIPAYVTTKQEHYMDGLELEWVNQVPYHELCQKYNTSSVAFLYMIPHEGCSYSSMHFVEDGDQIWNEGCLLYLQDMYSPTYEYETPTVFAHELLHLFGAEDYYDSAEVFSKETYETLADVCADDIMLRTFTKINGVYTTFPDEVYGEITPVTAYLLGIGDEEVVADMPDLVRTEAACFPGSMTDRPF